ncbi:hypothetical protein YASMINEVIRUS_758 [Yasminevirus sp. GU-2018]|uniref:Uncharacterized protein n=1 Tax=Yasminevirus sp. GU-2018 TaxID=2420051 RepID=A0A5K0U928_9VIRU|nr:hypothetical protein YASMINEVIRUS_758 [Yasminevirus sp. GU-2018]
MSADNRETIIQIQRFTASSISMLNLLRTACLRMNDAELSERVVKGKARFMTSSQSFIDQLKDPETDFDYTRFIRKAFGTLKTTTHCEMLVNRDGKLFEARDEDGKIMTILPGLDLKVGYNFLDEKETVVFWQYMFLFSSAVFRLIKASNESAFEKKYVHVANAMTSMEAEIAKTGIMFNNQIFNPFIGVGDDKTGYSVNEMFTGGELPKQQNVSIESVLSMLGVDKMFDEQKLQDELKNFNEQHATEATDRIVGLLGASNNPEVREVCNVLIKDIVSNFKQNGINNVGDTLMKVAENAKKTIDAKKMQQTAESMKYFMANSQETMKDMKDANGNPIGQQLMNSMAVPLSMMNLMSKQHTAPQPSQNDENNVTVDTHDDARDNIQENDEEDTRSRASTRSVRVKSKNTQSTTDSQSNRSQKGGRKEQRD